MSQQQGGSAEKQRRNFRGDFAGSRSPRAAPGVELHTQEPRSNCAPGGWLQRCQQHRRVIRGKRNCCSQSRDGSSSKSKTTFREEGKSELMLAPASLVENIQRTKAAPTNTRHCCEERRRPPLQTPYSPPSDTGWA